MGGIDPEKLCRTTLSHIASWARRQYPTVIITGDLNLNRMEPSSPEGKLLLDLEVEQGLECMITKPTRIQMRGSLVNKSLIDVILTNHRNCLRTCGIYDPALSDQGLV